MSTMIERRSASSLLGNQRREDAARGGQLPSLVDLLSEGFYVLFMLKNGALPPHQAADEAPLAARRDAPAQVAGRGVGMAPAAAATAAATAYAAAAAPVAGGAIAEATIASPPWPAAPPAGTRAAAAETRRMTEIGLADEAALKEKVHAYLAEFDREARKLRAAGDDIEAAKYAYCAALDEIILGAQLAMSEFWQKRPLQLVVFGDQLAGEHFFDRLEALRVKGVARVQALQVFHMCLLMGFKGRHAHEAGDRLNYLTARLGEEIAHMKGKSRGFAPRAERPDQIVNKLRGEVPLWALSAVFALIALGVYGGLKSSLDHATLNRMASYADLVKLAPKPANLTITLP